MKLSVLILCVFNIGLVLGQQRPQFSQYMLNKYYENPAYGGLERSLCIFTSYRNQYSEFPGGPSTFYIGADMPFYIWNGAIGFSVYNQKSGVFNNTNLKLSYNYVMNSAFGFFSFGGRLGIDRLDVNGGGIITPDGTYEGVFSHNDPTLDVVPFGGMGLSWEMGAYFYGNELEAGILLSELPTHKFAIGDGNYNRAFSGSAFIQYKYSLSDEIRILPSALIKADQAVLQAEIGVLAKFKDNLVTGLNFRGYNQTSIDAFSVIIGTNLGKKYFVSYSYDFSLSKIKEYSQGSHEIMLSYNLQKLIGIGLPPKIIYNPRDL